MLETGYQKLVDRIAVRRKELTHYCEQLFDAHKDITLEIGCGHGDYLTGYAAAFPEEFCVGIDIMGKRINKSHRKRNRMERYNLEFIKVEATEFLEILPQDIKLKRIIILFPDPWPKQRHHRRRLIQEEFLQTLAKASHSEAELFFRTDHSEYFEYAKRELEKSPYWKVEHELVWPFEKETFFQRVTCGYQSLMARCVNQ